VKSADVLSRTEAAAQQVQEGQLALALPSCLPSSRTRVGCLPRPAGFVDVASSKKRRRTPESRDNEWMGPGDRVDDAREFKYSIPHCSV
jgi:hypothetical protein